MPIVCQTAEDLHSAMSLAANSLTTFVNAASLVIDGRILLPVAAAQNALIDVLVRSSGVTAREARRRVSVACSSVSCLQLNFSS